MKGEMMATKKEKCVFPEIGHMIENGRQET
jgi:hypothetical protein